ncbi:hypothetical protein ANMWB30_23200 [Arthrobacter sp. MWB30]|nr:hypothetical protein ANMWB30_23200 [Arthrobacter sp. MWB30]
MEAIVVMETVSFEHHTAEKNYRPLLHLSGELQSLKPDDPLPCGISEVTFRQGAGPMVDAFYEFDDEQLTELVAKGYFTEGFEPPEDRLLGIPWELPTTINALVIPPATLTDAPVVFVTVHGQTELALDLVNSGYDLAEEFENTLESGLQKNPADVQKHHGVPTRSGEIKDLFADEDLELDEARGSERLLRPGPGAGEYPVVRASIFDGLMAEFEARQRQEEAERGAQPAYFDPDSVEGVYQHRILPGVEKALTMVSEDAVEPVPVVAGVDGGPAAEASVPAGPSLLDLYDEEPVGTSGLPSVAAPKTPHTHRVRKAPEHEQALAMTSPGGDDGPELG